MSIGWVENTSEANTYMTYRTGAQKWADATDPQKTAALTTSYYKIKFSSTVSVPPTPTASELERLKVAQMEYALILLMLGEAGTRRDAIQAAGVVSSGILQESYRNNPGGLPDQIPSSILNYLSIFQKPAFYSIPIIEE